MDSNVISPLPKLAKPAVRALHGAEIITLNDLSKWTERDCSQLH